MSQVEARCPVCQRLLFRFGPPRAYAPGSETTQSATPDGLAIEVKCSRCHSLVTFSVPGGIVVSQTAGNRPVERRMSQAHATT